MQPWPGGAEDSHSAGHAELILYWFRQALARKPTKMPVSPESALSDVSHPSSPDSPPSLGSSSEVSPIPAPSHRSADGGGGSGNSGNSSGGRWSKDYDVCVCHSEEDLAAAQELVSYLEGGAASLRCFLQLRDATPGGAIVSELCHALSSSHCRVLLITPGFLRDPWCRYQMLQALSEAPGAEGRTIPLMSGLSRAAYPAELRYMYFVDGRGPEGGFRQVKEAVMRCKLWGRACSTWAFRRHPVLSSMGFTLFYLFRKIFVCSASFSWRGPSLKCEGSFSCHLRTLSCREAGSSSLTRDGTTSLPSALHWEHRVLTARPPGKSLGFT
uniref:TIR domain containing adaptor protein n=1 Tax=Bos indicus x Bos taurus TaxID=30522 RepID=A0A4W2IJX0_BOBOX